jgi:hypothetical protein
VTVKQSRDSCVCRGWNKGRKTLEIVIRKEEVIMSFAPFSIPIAVTLGAFAIVITAMILQSKARDRQQRERMFLAEKGLEVPSELYDVKKTKKRDFRGGRAWLMILGTICICVGIGVMIMLGVKEGMDDGVAGVIPILIGVGFLLSERMIAKLADKSPRE